MGALCIPMRRSEYVFPYLPAGRLWEALVSVLVLQAVRFPSTPFLQGRDSGCKGVNGNAFYVKYRAL